MLVKWEAGDPEVRALWEKMNNWVYAGFDETYKALGVGFDKIYYEEQYLLGRKKKVEEGLEKGLFHPQSRTTPSGQISPTRDSTRNSFCAVTAHRSI